MPNITIATPLYEPPSETLRHLPEGPYPLGESRFSWVAIQHGPQSPIGSLNLFDLAAGTNQTHELPGRPGFAFPCDDGRSFVIGCERQLGLFDVENGSWRPFLHGIDQGVTNTIVNDAVVVDDNLVFGTKDLEFAHKKAGLYLYRGSDRQLLRLRDDQVCSNGKAILRDADRLFLLDIDSPTRQVVRYRLDVTAGALDDRTVLIDLQDDPAVPDGMILTPDRRGAIVSMFHPGIAPHGETRLYDLASGRLEHVWQTPASPRNTCPNLIRHAGRVQLVITTAVEGMPPEQRQGSPAAGCLFIAPTDFPSTGDVPLFPVAAAGL